MQQLLHQWQYQMLKKPLVGLHLLQVCIMYISLSLVLFRQLLIMYVIMYMVMAGHHKVHPDIPSQRNLSMEEILKVFKISEYQI